MALENSYSLRGHQVRILFIHPRIIVFPAEVQAEEEARNKAKNDYKSHEATSIPFSGLLFEFQRQEIGGRRRKLLFISARSSRAPDITT